MPSSASGDRFTVAWASHGDDAAAVTSALDDAAAVARASLPKPRTLLRVRLSPPQHSSEDLAQVLQQADLCLAVLSFDGSVGVDAAFLMEQTRGSLARPVVIGPGSLGAESAPVFALLSEARDGNGLDWQPTDEVGGVRLTVLTLVLRRLLAPPPSGPGAGSPVVPRVPGR